MQTAADWSGAPPHDRLGAPAPENLRRKPELTEHQRQEAIRRRDRDGEPLREIARSYNVSPQTISRL